MPDAWGLARTAEGLFAHGEIDGATADPFEERASEAVMEAAGSIVLIDLSGVTFMDSAGMRALVRVLQLRSGKSLIVGGSALSNLDSRCPRECLSSRHSSALSRDIVPTSGGRGRGCRSRGWWSRRSGSKEERRPRWPATTGSPHGGSTSAAGGSTLEGR